MFFTLKTCPCFFQNNPLVENYSAPSFLSSSFEVPVSSHVCGRHYTVSTIHQTQNMSYLLLNVISMPLSLLYQMRRSVHEKMDTANNHVEEKG